MALISVTEYSKKIGKDPGTIRKHLISGRLEGFKIGNQWVIDEGQPFTEDRRVRSGKYVNWRKGTEAVPKANESKKHVKPAKAKENYGIISNDEEVVSAVKDTVSFAKKALGEHLKAIILYGKCVSSQPSDSPDVELALKLSRGYSKEGYDDLLDFASIKEIEQGMVLEITCIEIEKYEEMKDAIPFYKKIQSEGIALWER